MYIEDYNYIYTLLFSKNKKGKEIIARIFKWFKYHKILTKYSYFGGNYEDYSFTKIQIDVYSVIGSYYPPGDSGDFSN